MGVQLVPYAASDHEDAFLAALNEAIAMTADCYPVTADSQAVLCVALPSRCWAGCLSPEPADAAAAPAAADVSTCVALTHITCAEPACHAFFLRRPTPRLPTEESAASPHSSPTASCCSP